ncbi:DUF7604 domain-containing protein [Bifidobacterium moukalabense]|uniref:DUF7604 domain-containing protein n=1 Tax=Bifidobacterium moukalabense TaxID=1333651 RepID=UPI0010F65F1E|nr:VWA domain-containing protein [Bifidobacterium moukalabense]
MKDIREHQARPKGNLAKRIIAAIAAVAMLGGVGYATATTAVAEDTSVTQTQTTEPQTEKTTDAGSNAATEGSSTDTDATAEGSSANSNEATEGSSTDANAAVEGNDAENTDAEEEDPQADDTAATPVDSNDAVPSSETDAKNGVAANASETLGSPEKHKRIQTNNDGTYTVNVDVTGAESSSTITSSQPVDFTLVLDVSESMNEKLGNNITKLKALENAVNSFLDQAATINKAQSDSTKHIHVGLITFSSSAQVVSNLTDDLTSLETKVNSLQTTRGTRADLGLDKVNSITGVRSTAKQVVIFFTDGAPRSGDGSAAFEDSVAANAVKAAKNLKDAGKTIYSIGVVDGADPTDTSKNINKFLHAVSSNYPSATATYQNRNTTFTLGAGGNNGYYKVASDAAGLTKVFDEIQKSETTTSAYTNVKMEDTLSSYVELSDMNYTVTAKDASGNAVTLTEGTDYKLTYATKKFTVEFLKPLSHGVTYTLSYNVKPTQEAYDEYAANGYGDTVGDEGTDLDGNTSSSGKPGFHSNESACLSYTADGVNHACADNPYPHPVIQVMSGQIDVTKTWTGDEPTEGSVTFTLTKEGDTTFSKTINVSKGDDNQWKGSFKNLAPGTYTVTETAVSGYTVDEVDGNTARTVTITADDLWSAWKDLKPQHDDNVKAYSVTFNNTRDTVSLNLSIAISKKVVGNDYSGKFQFTLTGPDQAEHSGSYVEPTDDPTVILEDFTANEIKMDVLGGTLKFKTPTNDTEDEYTFHITEVKGDTTGWHFDQSDYKVIVKVSSTEAWIDSIVQIKDLDGNEVNKPVSLNSDSDTQATVSFVNRYFRTTVLPFTGGTTDRQWLLVSGGIAGMAALMIGAAGIWRGKKRLV